MDVLEKLQNKNNELEICKKIINVFDLSIVIFHKNLDFFYGNNFFNKIEIARIQNNKTKFKEIFPEYNKNEIYKTINYIFENNTNCTLYENEQKLDMYAINNEYFIFSVGSDIYNKQKIDSEKTKILLNNMNHAIRTPLNGITGMVAVLIETELTIEQYEYIKKIQESSLSLVNIVSDLLDFLKLETKNLTLNLDPFNLEDCINSCINIIQKKAFNKEIQIYKIFHNDVHKFVIGDLSRIKQILLNILDNAIKFTEKGFIKIEITEDPILTINISDSGIGMKQEQVKNLFKITNENDYKHNKIGLGIPITKYLVELMNGTIHVQSKITKGTTFSISLPLKHYNINPKKIVNQKKILIFHTDIQEKINISKMIMNTNYIPISVSTIDEALIYFNDTTFDLVILNNKSYIEHFISNKILLINDSASKIQIDNVEIIKSTYNLENLKIIIEEIIENKVNNRKLNILNIDDVQINQIINEKLLNTLGFQNIKNVSNGNQAIEEIKNNEYDIILLDIKMPQKDGFEVLDELKQNNIKIPYTIIMTAYVTDDITNECKKRKVNDILYKPIKLEDLQIAIKKAQNTLSS